jgi:spermidine/putrescine transport system permease protein
MNKQRKSYLLFIYAFLYVPLLVLITYSFIDHHHFTFTWYIALFSDSQLWQVSKNSLLLAISVSSIATSLGTLMAIVLVRYRFFGKNFLSGTIMSYIILPDLLLGVSFLILLHLLHIPFGFLTLLIGQITLCLPYVVMMINARLLDLNHRIFEAAKDLGASEFTIYRRIITPLLATAIIGAWIICFTLSMDDVIVSFFLSGPGFQVLPLYIYSLVRLGVTPEINAICSIIFFVTLLFVLLAQWGVRKK